MLNLKGFYHKIKNTNFNFKFSPDRLKNSIKSSLPQWMENQIESELSFFSKTGVNIDAIEYTISECIKLKNKPQIVRIIIKNNKILIKNYMPNKYHPRFIRLINFLRACLNCFKCPNVDLLYAIDDSYDEKCWLEKTLAPMFVISKKNGNNKAVLFPHIEWISQNDQLLETIEQYNNKYPWEKKKLKAYWVGGSSGAQDKIENNLRYKIIQISKNNPHILDASFSELSQWNRKLRQQYLSDNILKIGLKPYEQIINKYLISVDGNAFPGSLFWQLFSNSVVLKNKSEYLEWYYPGLESGSHYIEFSLDDLIEKIKYLQINDAYAKAVALKSVDFAKANLSNEMIVTYIYKLLEAYSAICR